ncbi:MULTISPECIES: toxin [unclassified Pseudomonas]|uniref:toxin n=1 Tax=unclassified Pseudomonas TaxID=196821 RepID=UPI000A1E3658|nr:MULTISPECIES: toxin [unclassified Pseudomonas]
MDAVFVELPPFERYRAELLSEEQFRCLQQILLSCPHAGDVIRGTGGLRKMRFSDPLRHKGKRGGIRVIYYYWLSGMQFWLFTLYGKDMQDDLTDQQRKTLRTLLERECLMRTHHAPQPLH